MSNTKQQIEEMISDFGEDSISYGEELHTGRVKSDDEIKSDSAELLRKQTEIVEAIDRLVTEAVISELKQLEPPEQYEEYARLMGSEHCRICGFNAVEFRKYISKEIAELQSQLTNKEEK